MTLESMTYDDVKRGKVDIYEFLDSQNEDVIIDRMLSKIDDSKDVSEGSYLWDSTVPSAFEHAQMYFTIRWSLGLMFPQSSYGEFLSGHAIAHGAPRREAVIASGYITVTGSKGTLIPAGTKFCTTVDEGNTLDTPQYYSTVDEAVIPDAETIDIPIVADTPGEEGDALAGEINVNIQKITGIFKVFNAEPVTGGIPEEDDDVLEPRLMEHIRNPRSSGNVHDYKAWAKEVPGVGEVIVQPRWDGVNTVKVIIVGMDGQPVSDEIVEAVQLYLDPAQDGKPGEGKAPTGAIVTVTSIAGVLINIDIPNIEYDEYIPGEDIVMEDLRANLEDYLASVPPGGKVRLKEIESVITESPGIADFDTVSINGQSANLQLLQTEKGVLGEVVLV